MHEVCGESNNKLVWAFIGFWFWGPQFTVIPLNHTSSLATPSFGHNHLELEYIQQAQAQPQVVQCTRFCIPAHPVPLGCGCKSLKAPEISIKIVLSVHRRQKLRCFRLVLYYLRQSLCLLDVLQFQMFHFQFMLSSGFFIFSFFQQISFHLFSFSQQFSFHVFSLNNSLSSSNSCFYRSRSRRLYSLFDLLSDFLFLFTFLYKDKQSGSFQSKLLNSKFNDRYTVLIQSVESNIWRVVDVIPILSTSDTTWSALPVSQEHDSGWFVRSVLKKKPTCTLMLEQGFH